MAKKKKSTGKKSFVDEVREFFEDLETSKKIFLIDVVSPTSGDGMLQEYLGRDIKEEQYDDFMDAVDILEKEGMLHRDQQMVVEVIG